MRALLAAAFALIAQGCAAPAQVGTPAANLAPEHLNPVALNEFAAASVREGDIDTAWILLERAAHLAPHDSRITANLEVVRAWRARRNQ
ncbi:MAG: hypothetical protein ACKVQT_18275 [Burkholderiales bacterium]